MGTQQSGNGAGTRNRMTGCQSGRDTFPVNPLDPVDQPSGPCGPTLWTQWANPLDPVGQPSGPCGPTLWTLWTNPLDPLDQPSRPSGPTLWTVADPVRPHELAQRVVNNRTLKPANLGQIWKSVPQWSCDG